MNTKKKNNPFQGPSFERYNTLRQQLQKQNVALLRERSRIQQQNNVYQGIPSHNTIVEKNQLSIREEDEQDEIQIPHFEESNQSREKNGQIKRRQRSMRDEINQKGEPISDNVMEMIEQIERKALDQIQSLRADKISLMKRLNRQMKDHNHQKQKKSNHEERYSRQRVENKGGNIPSQTKIRQEMPIPIQQQNSDQLSPSNRKYQPQQQQYPQFNSNEQSRNSQGLNRNIPQHQQPMRINNQNVIPSQSFYYVDKPPKVALANRNIRANQPQQNNFEKQLHRLRQENMGLRQAYSQAQRSENFVGDSNKARLKSQLSELYAKAKHFQQLLAHERTVRNARAPNIEGSQVQTLLLQSANLAQEGQRLMRVKSNPQFSSSSQMIRSPIRFQANSQTGSRPFIEPSLMTPIQNSRGRNINMSKFSPGQYEKLIDNMRKAANS